ncbi:WD40 repeat-like protein [Favolaschia claudopus]|uniref:WD40 repeat-like protein n=1 Tax=Favolaschia claudopus TaxID=2862362 RepID=A0AAV9Z1S0_9AGAR
MAQLYSFATDVESVKKPSKTFEDVLLHITMQTVECAFLIQDYYGHGFLGATGKIDEMTKKLLRLKDAFDRGIAVQTTLVSAKILDKVENLENLELLKKLRPASFSDPEGCLPGTRTKVIKNIALSLTIPSEKQIIWLSGVAGSGKSTIATSISEHFRVLGRLGAQIRFSRNHGDRSDKTVVLHTIASGLANTHPHIKQAICNTLAHDSHLVEAPPETQFEELILNPLNSVKQHLVGPLIIVIDALDECAEDSRNWMIKLIANSFPKLPAAFRVLVTSRPEQDITRIFTKDITAIHQCPLNTNQETNSDISIYIHHHLKIIQDDRGLGSQWPEENTVDQLINRSGNLFIWAATALKFVGERKAQPQKRLEAVLKMSFKEDNLDQLYALALESNGDWADPEFRESATAILSTIALAKLPMTDSAIDSICGLSGNTTAYILQHFGSVIQWNTGRPATTLHASFNDFILRPNSVTPNFDSGMAKKSIVLGCFKALQNLLEFNVCHLPDSHLLNCEVPTAMKVNLPDALTYTSRFWGSHLAESGFDEKVLQVLKEFLANKFLFWLEVVSVLGELAAVEQILQVAQQYVQGKDNWMMAFIQDGQRFASVFAPAIVQSAPHIYISALPLTPKDSLIRRQFLPLFPNLLQHTVPVAWSRLEKIIQGHSEYVTSVAFSPDGKQIVSGSDDNTVRVWDAVTGVAIGSPLEGHSHWVTSVAFSPDGKQIVSGSYDKTVRLWDTVTGVPIGSPLEGHSSYVNSVAFSSDGKQIVSGSHDMTVRVWETATGDAVGTPLEGHSDYVTSVAFSPDGKHIASGSLDKTVRVWDTATDGVVGTPLEGHSRDVNAVAFSPDGKHIVSGSDDMTVRVWDTATGTAVGTPVKGHSYNVSSVAFSPDGKHIVSGSDDMTVRVWDTATGTAVGTPLKGHSYNVSSVAFSPDGKHIVSGSYDNTVRVWEATTDGAVGTSPAGHSDRVTSVAFSADGKHIVSGSHDKTVRVWDAATGLAIGTPLEGHSHWVTSVAFSPDGKQIVSGSFDETVRLWDTVTGVAIGSPLEGHSNWVNSVAFSPDGKHIVSGSDDNTVRVWDAVTGVAIGSPLEGHSHWVTSVAFSPDGKQIVSGSYDKTVRLWDTVTGVPIGSPLEGHSSYVNSVAFSPDGKHIVSGSLDKTVQVWDATRGVALGLPLEGHSWGVISVAFSPDGKHIVSGSADSTVRVWDAITGAAVGTPLKGHSDDVCSVAFSPDGKHIVSGSDDKTVRLWAKVTESHPMCLSDVHHSGAIPTENDCHMALRQCECTFQDGWIASTSSRILWIPPHLRNDFCLPWCCLVISPSGVKLLDLSHFVHGKDWTKCQGSTFSNQIGGM